MSGGTIWVVPVKGASERMPGKNVRPLGPKGWPMFIYSVKAALGAGGSVVVATDDAEVRFLANTFCPEAIVLDDRPAYLSKPEVSAVDVVLWAMGRLCVPYRDDWAVGMLLPTSPLRTTETIQRCLELWSRDTRAAAMTVRRLHGAGLRYENGATGWLNPLRAPGSDLEGWPKATPYLSTGGVQLTSAATLYECRRYWVPKSRGVEVDEIEGLDVDWPTQFMLAEAWLWREEGAACVAGAS